MADGSLSCNESMAGASVSTSGLMLGDEDNVGTLVDEEYSSQFLGFTPRSFCNGIYNAFIQYLADCLTSMAIYMEQKFADIENPESIQAGIADIKTKGVATIDGAFDKLESYLQNSLFRIPDHVLLPEDIVQLNATVTAEQEEQIDIDIKELNQKILALKYSNSTLEKEFERMSHVKERCDSILKSVQTLDKKRKQANVPVLRDTIVLNGNQAVQLIDTISVITKAMDKAVVSNDLIDPKLVEKMCQFQSDELS